MRNSMKLISVYFPGVYMKTLIHLLLFVVIVSCSLVDVKVPEGKPYKNSLGIEFVPIPEGEFQMGCTKSDTECNYNEKPQHTVKISKSFYIGKFEVTQGQWKMLMGNNPSGFQECGENCPVESVSWNDAQEFIKRLCVRENYSPCKYRLPTEAEWEYAARAGTKTKYYWGDTINDAYLWYNNNSGGTTNPVGKKKPNSWGLYDMSGNVWEWVEDWYDEVYYIKNPNINGPSSGKIRVLRGGSWNFKAGDGRLSYRGGSDPNSGEDHDGFRLVFLP
jgi:formylglycine-generating enzyme required for sulfatase activity